MKNLDILVKINALSLEIEHLSFKLKKCKDNFELIAIENEIISKRIKLNILKKIIGIDKE